jgi:hypothetical protein
MDVLDVLKNNASGRSQRGRKDHVTTTTMTMPTRARRATAAGPNYVFHPSFEDAGAEVQFDGEEPAAGATEDVGHMIDEVTRATVKRMHYAAWRWHQAQRSSAIRYWRQRYYHLRDLVVLGNRKLVFRAVSRRLPGAANTDDLVSDCQIVLLQAVAAYNPWLGIRFSTYAFTCLMRALARLSQKQGADWLSRSLPLEALPQGEPRDGAEEKNPGGGAVRLDEYLRTGTRCCRRARRR